MQMQQQKCEAITRKTTRCTKNAKHFSARSERNLCKLHFDKEERDALNAAAAAAAELETEEEKKQQELTLDQFDISTKGLSAEQLAKLKRKLARRAKASDGPGCIYIYSMANEQGMDYWKVGTTKKEGDTRLAEWEAEHKVRILKRAVFKVSDKHEYIERLIHLFLADCRLVRIPIKGEKHMLSKYYETNEFLQDRVYEELVAKYETLEKVLEKKEKRQHKEWFWATIEVVEKVVAEVIKQVN